MITILNKFIEDLQVLLTLNLSVKIGSETPERAHLGNTDS